MTRLNWGKVSKNFRAHNQGSEKNTLLPGGEGEEASNVDPNYKPKKSSFERISIRVGKLLKKEPGLKFVDRVKPFEVERKKKKKISK